jgi:hypothetical protein
VAFLAADNTGKSSRSGTLTVAGYVITLTEGPSTTTPTVRVAPANLE